MSPQELRQAAAQRRRFAREARRAGRDSDTGAFAPHLSVVTCLAADDSELIWGPLVDVGEADSMDADLRDVLLSRGWREVSGGSGHDHCWGAYLAEDYRIEPDGLEDIDDVNVILAAPTVEISIVGVLGGGDDITALHYTASQFGAKPTEPTRYSSRAQVLAELDRFEAICSAWNPPSRPH